jgi:hypothetical protein
VAEQFYRPISRKYDKAEHAYPKELDTLAALLDGMNEGSDEATGATSASKRPSREVEAGNKNGGNLSALLGDELGSNTGTLEGVWVAKGTVQIGTVTYKVYDHSTTQAQVLVTIEPSLPLSEVGFSSMTKDSGLTANADWTTLDTSAGRLVSGYVDEPLAAGETVKVYSNGVLIGDAVVNGTQWAITDPKGYAGNWTYSANVVSGGVAGTTATQVVNADMVTIDAPVITSAGTDAAFTTTIANNGTTTDNTLVVKGTGVPGSYITLYDNSLSAVVKTNILVGANGEWVADLTGTPLPNGVQNFYAQQSNVNGAASALSDAYVVTINGTTPNLVVNGSFENDVLGAGSWSLL